MIDPPQDRPEEPTAVTPHGGIRGGESQQWLSYPTDPPVRFGGRGDRTQSVLPTPIMSGMGTAFAGVAIKSGHFDVGKIREPDALRS